MAVANKMELGREIMRTLAQINRTMDLYRELQPEDSSPDIVTLASLLSAKAQCLHALAITNQREFS